MQQIDNFIDGQRIPPAGGKYLDNPDPATGRTYSEVADSDANDVNAAVQAAQRAFPSWSALPSAARARHLRAMAGGIQKRLDAFARAESVDNGKPITLARTVDIPRSIQNFEFFADAATQFSSESHQEPGLLNYTQRSPLGAVACISPWNLPLYLLTWKIAPALATGNCVVAKPSEVTPMTASLLGEVCAEAGLPRGVLNIVQGTGARVGAELVAHAGIHAVSFTGSTRVGAEIARVTAPRFKKVSLEMGGKNPTIIFADCDFERTVAGALRSAFSNQGQICLCGSRLLVERPLYERFRDAFLTRVKHLRQGDPLDPDTQQGAVVSKAHFDKVIGCLELARSEGGRFLTGGRSLTVPGRCEQGWFIEPTVIEGLGPACRTNQEEIFGPVVTLAPFDTEDQALELANSTSYGLAASVWTRDLSRAHRFSSQLRSGIVWVNCWMVRDLRTPFGGTKDSGVGREGGLEALRFFTEPKNICVRYSGDDA